MAKKRAEKGPSKKLPAEIIKKVLPNGDPYFEVKTYFSSINFTATYSNELISDLLAEWILTLYKAIALGTPLKDTPFEKIKINLHPDQEKKDVDEAWDILRYFIDRACRTFHNALALKLADFSDQLMTEVLISTMLEMEEGNVVVIEGGRIDVWDYYLDELKKVLKRSWNKTITRGAKYWTPEKRKGLLTLYEAALRDLRAWWQKHHRSRNPSPPSVIDWKSAEKDYPHLIPFLKELANSTPHELALEYISLIVGLRGEYLRKQITQARRESAAQKKTAPSS
jgi:hypothetical protein